MVQWNSSPHPISDIRDWESDGKLLIQPEYQRREVWSLSAQIMLMNTIIYKIPMPKIFLSSELKDGKVLRGVIDGQQRIKAILAFLRDEFSLDDSFDSELNGKYFSQLPEKIQNDFLMYSIDFNEAQNATDEEVRNVYSRVNKYTVALNKQELRKADFPGDFLDLSEQLALLPFLDEARIFTPANRRRYGDVEFVSELLVAMIGDVQDKKGYLEEFYRYYSTWNVDEKNATRREFIQTVSELEHIFGDGSFMARTRFRQKSDFYSLFLTVLEFVRDGISAEAKKLKGLREDLSILNDHIRPESEVDILKNYAVKCVSAANSASSRRWRMRFIQTILKGTYNLEAISEEDIEVFYRIKTDLDRILHFESRCLICGNTGENGHLSIGWHSRDSYHQISNSLWLHDSCARKKEFDIFPRPEQIESDLFPIKN